MKLYGIVYQENDYEDYRLLAVVDEDHLAEANQYAGWIGADLEEVELNVLPKCETPPPGMAFWVVSVTHHDGRDKPEASGTKYRPLDGLTQLNFEWYRTVESICSIEAGLYATDLASAADMAWKIYGLVKEGIIPRRARLKPFAYQHVTTALDEENQP